MTQRTKYVLLVALILVQGASAAAMTRAARKVGFLEFRGSYAMPQGTYDGLPGLDFLTTEDVLLNVDAERLYHDGYGFGLSYGQFIDKHLLISLGFDYTSNKIKRPIVHQSGDYDPISLYRDSRYSSYDLTLRTIYSVLNPVRHSWSPYVGLSAVGGLTRLSAPDVTAESEFAFGLNLDFGLDVKIWAEPDSRQFVTLSSINSWNFYTSKERVSHLQIGAGIKYFFGP